LRITEKDKVRDPLTDKKKVIVAMSGGVDSSVTAALLLEQGYDVTGVTMQIWDPDRSETGDEHIGCCSLTAVEDARSVANKLGIPFYVMNFRRIFEEKVIDYLRGNTCGDARPIPASRATGMSNLRRCWIKR
jgi:tRNA U34 2-thiouridine synthase MnmA/TrmU